MNAYLEKTALLNYEHIAIQALVKKNGWANQSQEQKILGIYNYVRDTIEFGYNSRDSMSASQIIEDGYGQCNTKGILFMALLRAVQVPCRVHGFTIDKALQRGAITGFIYWLTPKELVHSWVEVYYNNTWINMEGFILDIKYLKSVQSKFSYQEGGFCGFGIATNNFQKPQIYWTGEDTYIQKEGIVRDFGLFDSPDALFNKHSQKLGLLKAFLFRVRIRKQMNKNIRRIRSGKG